MTQPIHCVDLFPGLNRLLLDLLRGLAADDWARPTVRERWDVKDVAAHILDGMLRRLSFQRDGYSPGAEGARSHAELVAMITVRRYWWKSWAKVEEVGP